MGPHVHHKLTRAWAMEEGFSEREAELIARADIGFDRRYPARASFVNITRHFAPTAWLWSARYLALAMDWGDLMMLGYALHCAQDGVAHGRIGTRHIVQAMGLRPDPDVWETSPAGVMRRTEAITRDRLRRFRAQPA